MSLSHQIQFFHIESNQIQSTAEKLRSKTIARKNNEVLTKIELNQRQIFSCVYFTIFKHSYTIKESFNILSLFLSGILFFSGITTPPKQYAAATKNAITATARTKYIRTVSILCKTFPNPSIDRVLLVRRVIIN